MATGTGQISSGLAQAQLRCFGIACDFEDWGDPRGTGLADRSAARLAADLRVLRQAAWIALFVHSARECGRIRQLVNRPALV
jgi:hypothetical protein